jgi:nucleoside-diphosphate-sugar epimerase
MSEPQTIFLTGATGAVGGPTTRALVAAGHTVRAAVRSQARAGAAAALGAEPVVVDIFDPRALAPAMQGADAVLNLATRIPSPAKAAVPGAWKENDRIRRQASTALVDAALEACAFRFVQESVVFMYADGGEAWLDEDAPVDTVSVVDSTQAAEANAARFAELGGVGTVLRFGLFYGAGSSHTEMAATTVRRGFSPVLGRPEAYQPSIHLDDAAAAVVAALNAPSGTFNITDDEPLTKDAYGHALATALGVKDPKLVPAGMVKLMGKKVNPISRSQRVRNTRFKEATGWAPQYPSVVEGWAQVAEQMATGAGAGTAEGAHTDG